MNARFTENGQELRLGDGLWGTASGPGNYKLYVADPEARPGGFYGTVMENGTPVLLALRLKVTYGLISEVETIVARGRQWRPVHSGRQGDGRAWQTAAAVPAHRTSGRAHVARRSGEGRQLLFHRSRR